MYPVTRRAALILLAALAMACGRPAHEEFSLVGSGIPVRELPTELGTVLEYQRSYGIGVLPRSFTYHRPAAVSTGGQMLLRSHTDCRFGVVNLSSGELVRYLGRCGDGPHESRAIAGAALLGDTILFAAVRTSTLRLIGPADTIVRRLQVPALATHGARGLLSLSLISDTTAFVALSVSAGPGEPVAAPLFGLLDLGSGRLEPVPFTEPPRRLEAAREVDRFYHACASRFARMMIVENNGPAEYVGVGWDGQVGWAARSGVSGIDPGAARIEGSRSAAFRWNRLPVRPACSATQIYSRVLPLQATDPRVPLGHVVVMDFDGHVLLNAPALPTDSLLIQANWFADDSTLYVATTQAPSPRVLAFRLRARLPGVRGVFLLPDSVRADLERDLLGAVSPDSP